MGGYLLWRDIQQIAASGTRFLIQQAGLISYPSPATSAGAVGKVVSHGEPPGDGQLLKETIQAPAYSGKQPSQSYG